MSHQSRAAAYGHHHEVGQRVVLPIHHGVGLEEVAQQQAALSATLDDAVRQLSHQKTDRASLATLFQELSQRLSHDQPPQQA